MPDKERHWLIYMGAQLHGRGMVGHHGNTYWLIPLADGFVNGFHGPAVKILDGFQLQFQVAVVPCLVTGLDMQEHEILMAQGFEGGLYFPS